MARYLYLTFLLVVITLTSCASEQKAEGSEIEFEKVIYDYIQPAPDRPGEPSTISFEIDWPIKGDEELVNTLRSWILTNISPITLVLKEGEPLKSVLEYISPEIVANGDFDCFLRTTIIVKAEPNSPFDGYITLHAVKTNSAPPSCIEDSYSDITIRLSDNKQFNYHTAIGDRELFRQMIINNIDWWDNDVMYDLLSDIPYPTFPIGLTKDGVEVRYDSTLGRGHLGFTVTVPYSEVIPALSDMAKDFLPADIINSANTSKDSRNNIESEVTAFLYQTFYSDTALSGEVSNVGYYSLGYSDEALRKFKDLGINSEIDYPINPSLEDNNKYYQPYYTDNLNRLLKKITTALSNPDNFDLRLLMRHDFEGEEPPFNLNIKNVKVESPEKVTITAKENPECDDAAYVLVKQNGKWYIDDIYDYRNKARLILGN